MTNKVKKSLEFDTYCTGPSFVTHGKGLSTKDIVALCRHLEECFGEGNEFTPEPVTGGGLQWVKWPGKQEEEYKTLRFCVDRECGGWPWIDSDTYSKWKGGDSEMIFKSSACLDSMKASITMELTIGTFLKAFHGAPVWTVEELAKVEQCFGKIGFRRLGKRIPKKGLSQVAFTHRGGTDVVVIHYNKQL